MSTLPIGQTFMRLTVVGPASPDRWDRARSECLCRCGKTVIANNSDLTRSRKSTKSCGCYNRDCTRQRNRERREEKHDRFRDLTGIKQQHGRLTAIKVVGFDKDFRHAQWKCLCDPEIGGCGNTTIVLRGAFLDETTKSCGCLLKEVDRAGEHNGNYRHGRCVVQQAPA